MGENLREDVWKTIAPVLHGIQRTSGEIILLELDSLRNFREACLSHLKPSLCGFRKSRCFEQSAELGRHWLRFRPARDKPDIGVLVYAAAPRSYV